MASIDPIGLIFLAILLAGLFVGAVAYPLWFILHKRLTRKLDSILFREPYFNKQELTNYLVWPLVMVRSLNYIYLIALPQWAKKKRFKGFNQHLPVSRVETLACRVEAALVILGVLLFVLFFGFGSAVMLFDTYWQ
jgi:hypothetical protein